METSKLPTASGINKYTNLPVIKRKKVIKS